MRQLRLVLHCRNDGYLETIGRRRRANIKQSKAKIQQCVSILRERVKAKLTSAPATRAFNSNKLKRKSSTNLWADKYFQFCSKKLEENIGHSFCCFSLYQKPPWIAVVNTNNIAQSSEFPIHTFDMKEAWGTIEWWSRSFPGGGGYIGHWLGFNDCQSEPRSDWLDQL